MSGIRGVVFGCVSRKMQTLSTAERALLTELVEEVSRMSRADIRKAVVDLRTLPGIHGPALARQIRDIIDNRYASRISARVLCSS